MKDFFTSELIAGVFALLQNPSTYAWALLIVIGLFGFAQVCNALAVLVKLFK